jgi:uncharacterized OsmC-like protein
MTLQMLAGRRHWDLKKVTVTLSEQLVPDPAQPGQKITQITETIEVEGNLDPPKLAALQQAASKCPVYKLLTGPKQIVTNLVHVAPPPAVPQPPAAQPPTPPDQGAPPETP